MLDLWEDPALDPKRPDYLNTASIPSLKLIPHLYKYFCSPAMLTDLCAVQLCKTMGSGSSSIDLDKIFWYFKFLRIIPSWVEDFVKVWEMWHYYLIFQKRNTRKTRKKRKFWYSIADSKSQEKRKWNYTAQKYGLLIDFPHEHNLIITNI